MKHGIAAVLCLLLLGGCATTYEGQFDPALVPRGASSAPENRVPGRVALLVPTDLQVTVVAIGQQMRLHAVSIVERTLLAALVDEFRGGADRVDAVPAGGGRYQATLGVDAVRFELSQRLLWYVPLSLLTGISKYESSALLALYLTLFDAQGRAVWTRAYSDDVGRLTWTSPPTDSESLPEGITRLAHEAAWRLSQQAARDLRDWLEAERAKPRKL
jgi:hypothetical protein